MLTLIAAIGRNNEIGYKNRLLWDIPEDMKHFRSYTMGKTVLMGRNTFESIGSKPLSGRLCMVVSSNTGIGCPGVDVISSIDSIPFEWIEGELVVIGGASVYNQTIDRADKLVITHVDASADADTFFPLIDLSVWKINKTTPIACSVPARVVEYIK